MGKEGGKKEKRKMSGSKKVCERDREKERGRSASQSDRKI